MPTGIYERKSTSKRFAEKISKTKSCWLWLGKGRSNGYGMFSLNGKNKLAHRCSYQFYKGTFSEKLFVLHTCDNRICVNPDHLFLGSQADNITDCVNKKRNAFGEKCGRSKLTKDQVLSIRNLLKTEMSHGKIASLFGVKRATISQINRGYSWSKV